MLLTTELSLQPSHDCCLALGDLKSCGVLFLLVSCVWVLCLHDVCFLHAVPAAARRGRPIPLGLKLLMIVSGHVSAGNRKPVQWKNSLPSLQYPSPLALK